MKILPIGEPMLETARPYSVEGLLHRGELVGVEIEDVGRPGAADLDVLQTEAARDLTLLAKSGEISSENPERVHMRQASLRVGSVWLHSATGP